VSNIRFTTKNNEFAEQTTNREVNAVSGILDEFHSIFRIRIALRNQSAVRWML